MGWEEFYQHPSVTTAVENFNKPAGQLLFRKVLHGMIAHLNGYKKWVEIMSSFAIGEPVMRTDNPIPNIPDDVQTWYLKWTPFVESWLSGLFILQRGYNAPQLQEEINWQDLIIELSTIPTEISQQYAEAQQLTIPMEKLTRDFVENAIRCISVVNRMCLYTENEEYLRLWTIDDENLDS